MTLLVVRPRRATASTSTRLAASKRRMAPSSAGLADACIPASRATQNRVGASGDP